MHINTLVLGGGVSGISFGHFYNKNDYLIIEKADRLGGLCKSFKVGDSIFDYSGHFVHFKDPEIEKYVKKIVAKHATGEFKLFDRRAGIAMMTKSHTIDRIIDYPFQANIHQLKYDEFISCLTDLYSVSKAIKPDIYSSFDELVRYTFGDSIVDIFFKPYNEKLYRTPLAELSYDGMKRFIPKVTFDEVIDNFKTTKEFGYNSTFLYSPTSGIQGLIDALVKEKPLNNSTTETILDIDLNSKIVKTDLRTITYETLVNTLPLTLFTKLAHQDDLHLRHVDVMVYNITYCGTQTKYTDRCWLYVPDPEVIFYRVGFYSFMSKKEDTSVYVEVSSKKDRKDKRAIPDIDDIDICLKKAGFINNDAVIKDSQKLLMTPAYAILEKDTDEEVSKYRTSLERKDVYLTGRYGNWSYESIEDNIRNAKNLATKLSTK